MSHEIRINFHEKDPSLLAGPRDPLEILGRSSVLLRMAQGSRSGVDVLGRGEAGLGDGRLRPRQH